MAKIVKVVSLFNEPSATRAQTTYATPNFCMPWLYTAGNYDGTVQVYLEVVLKISNATYTARAGLYTEAGTLVTGSTLTTQSTTETRLRSGDLLSALSDGTAYQVRFSSDSTSGTTTLTAARLIIVQTGTITKTETVYDFGANNALAATGSYADDNLKARYYYDSDQFDGTVALYFEAHISNNGAGNTTYAQLHDGSNAVASSEVSRTATTDARVRSSAISLSDNTTYKVQIKGTAGTARCRAARLIIVQTATPTKTESYYPVKMQNTTTTATTDTNVLGNIYWDNDEWDVGSKNVYFESWMKISSGTKEANTDLNDGSTDLATVSTNATDITRVRSASITPTDNTVYDAQIRITATSATETYYGSYLPVQATITAAGTTVNAGVVTSTSSVISSTCSSVKEPSAISSASSVIAPAIQISTTKEVGVLGTTTAVQSHVFVVSKSPSVTSAAVSTQTPTVLAEQNVTVTPTVLANTSSLQGSSILEVVTPTSQVVNPSLQSPIHNVSVNPATALSTGLLQTQTVSAEQNVTLSPTVLGSTGSLQSPSLLVVKEPTTLGATTSMGSPTPVVGIEASTLTSIASAQAPTISAGQSVTVTPSVFGLTTGLPSWINEVRIGTGGLETASSVSSVSKLISKDASVQSGTASIVSPTMLINKIVSELSAITALQNPSIVNGDITLAVGVLAAGSGLQSSGRSILKPITQLSLTGSISTVSKTIRKQMSLLGAISFLQSITIGIEQNRTSTPQAFSLLASLITPTFLAVGPSIVGTTYYSESIPDESGTPNSLTDTSFYNSAMSDPSTTPNSIADTVFYDESLA